MQGNGTRKSENSHSKTNMHYNSSTTKTQWKKRQKWPGSKWTLGKADAPSLLLLKSHRKSCQALVVARKSEMYLCVVLYSVADMIELTPCETRDQVGKKRWIHETNKNADISLLIMCTQHRAALAAVAIAECASPFACCATEADEFWAARTLR